MFGNCAAGAAIPVPGHVTGQDKSQLSQKPPLSSLLGTQIWTLGSRLGPCLVINMFVQPDPRWGLQPSFLWASSWKPSSQMGASWGGSFSLSGCSAHSLLWFLGIGKLASVPAGGAVAVSAAPGSAAPAAGSAPAAGKWGLRQRTLQVCWRVWWPGPYSLAFSPQPRRRKMRRRRSPRSRMTTWDSACLISLLPLQIKSFLHISEGLVTIC